MTQLQRGIAIAPILFVVALLAVLASAIAAGGGASNSDTSAVKVKAQAAAILEYANELQTAVQKVIIGNGCKETEISLANPIVSGYENAYVSSPASCHVFDVNGGGIVWKNPPSGIDLTSVPESTRNYWIHTQNEIWSIGRLEIGNNLGRDLVLMLPGLTKELCTELNNRVDVKMPNGIPNGANPAIRKETQYWNDTTNGFHLRCGSTISPNLSKMACCTYTHLAAPAPSLLGTYVFHYVLWAR